MQWLSILGEPRMPKIWASYANIPTGAVSNSHIKQPQPAQTSTHTTLLCRTIWSDRTAKSFIPICSVLWNTGTGRPTLHWCSYRKSPLSWHFLPSACLSFPPSLFVSISSPIPLHVNFLIVKYVLITMKFYPYLPCHFLLISCNVWFPFLRK